MRCIEVVVDAAFIDEVEALGVTVEASKLLTYIPNRVVESFGSLRKLKADRFQGSAPLPPDELNSILTGEPCMRICNCYSVADLEG